MKRSTSVLVMFGLSLVALPLVTGCPGFGGLFGGGGLQAICPGFLFTGPLDGRTITEGTVEFNWICGATDRASKVFISLTETPFEDEDVVVIDVRTDRHGVGKVSQGLVAGRYSWGIEACAGTRCERFPEEGGIPFEVTAGGGIGANVPQSFSCAVGSGPLCPTFDWSLSTAPASILLVVGTSGSDAFANIQQIAAVPAAPGASTPPQDGRLEAPFCFAPNESRPWALWILGDDGTVVRSQSEVFTARTNPPQLLEPDDGADVAQTGLSLRWDADIADDAPGSTLRVVLTPCDAADTLFESPTLTVDGLPAGTTQASVADLDLTLGCWAWGVGVVSGNGEIDQAEALRACPDCCERSRTFTLAPDCNGNGVPDAQDIADGTSDDCNNDGIPDECQLEGNDCDDNGIPDECELAGNDCNNNGIHDACDIAAGTSQDINGNGIPDECEFSPPQPPPFVDCNENGIHDALDIANGTSEDENGNGVPDECERLYVNPFGSLTVTSGQTPWMLVQDGAAGLPVGTSWDNAFERLEDAIAAAADSNGQIRQIWVIGSTLRPAPFDEVPDRTATFRMLNGVAMFGGFCGSEERLSDRELGRCNTTLSGDLLFNDSDGIPFSNDDNAFHVVTADGVGPTAVLDGFTIVGGNADAQEGGDGRGGGLRILNASPTIRNCRFTRNDAFEAGGAVSIEGGNPTFVNCAFFDNLAGNGDNFGDGGAIFVASGSPNLINVTIAFNQAAEGGGIFNSGGTPTLVNTIVWSNSIGDIFDAVPGSTRATFSNIALESPDDVWPGEGNLNLFPEFSDFAGRLCIGSPSIDAGNDSAVPPGITRDIDGNSRFLDASGEGEGRVDMGAYEGGNFGNLCD